MRYTSVDGFNGGTTINDPEFESNGVECTAKEQDELWNAMYEFKIQVREGIDKKDKRERKELVAIINTGKQKDLERAIFVTLRKDIRKMGTWYFNVRTNPASVFSGDNTFGSLRVIAQVREVFNYVLDFFGKRKVDVSRLKKNVKRGDIHVHSVTFASYTSTLKNESVLRRMIDRWHFMYETRMRIDNRYVSLLEELGVSRANGEQYEDSISLSIFSSGKAGRDIEKRGNKLMHLCVYNKVEELRNKERLNEDDSELIADLSKRARLDLMVSNYFFRSQWNMKNGVTLRNIYEYVKKRWGEKMWEGAVEELMRYAIQRTCLHYMMKVPNPLLLQHRDMVKTWDAESEQRRGRSGKWKWSDDLKDWADSLGVDLTISSDAHRLMLLGQVGLDTNTQENVSMWLSSPKGTTKYLTQLETSLNRTRESKMLAKAVDSLKLDFSRPTYIHE